MLQIYVVLRNPEEAGIGVLLSIGISTLSTGFTSALISFDKDIDVLGRRKDPKLYGYIRDDHATRGRCFFLMIIISSCHNLSRSIGLALLAASGMTKAVYFVGGEMFFYFLVKIARRDFLYWLPIEGAAGVVASLIQRMIVKVIVDFSGCMQFRHPCEMGGLAFSLSMLWVSV